MSTYSEKLSHLRRELETIQKKRKKKRWKPNQKKMIDLINGVTETAVFIIRGEKIVLMSGDSKKGFRHIVEGHYHPNDLRAIDIVNIAETFDRGIKLAKEGVSDKDLDVYMFLKGDDNFRLVLKEKNEESWVITFYRRT